MIEEPFLLHDILDHNPAVRRALEDLVPDLATMPDWLSLSEALSGQVEDLVDGFLGNKSERVMLAAVLMRADYAMQAVEVSPNFWVAWSGLDLHNKALLMDLLAEELD